MKHFSRSNTRGKRARKTREANARWKCYQLIPSKESPLKSPVVSPIGSSVHQPVLPVMESLFDQFVTMILFAHALETQPQYSVKINEKKEENATKEKWKKENIQQQEPISRNMQLKYIPVTAFSWNDLFLGRIHFEWDSRGSAITSHKTIIDVTASLDRNCLSLTKEKVY